MCLPWLKLLNFPYCHYHLYSVHTKNCNPRNFPHSNFHLKLHNDSWNTHSWEIDAILCLWFLYPLLLRNKRFLNFYSNPNYIWFARWLQITAINNDFFIYKISSRPHSSVGSRLGVHKSLDPNKNLHKSYERLKLVYNTRVHYIPYMYTIDTIVYIAIGAL